MPTITSTDLMSILNWLYINGERTINLETPFIERPIMTISLSDNSQNWRIHLIVEKNDFSVSEKESEIQYADVGVYLMASGVIYPSNWNGAMEELRNFVKERLNRGSKFPRIAFDTSALMRRHFTHIDRHLRPDPKKSRNTAGYGYLLCSGVRKELVSWEAKYKREDAKRLSSAYPERYHNFSSFLGQPKYPQRKYWLGFVEIEKMKDTRLLAQCESQNPTSEREGDRDLKIIESLIKHSKEQDEDVITITADREFAANAHKMNLRSILLEMYPQQATSKEHLVDWTILCDTLYVFAVLCGTIRVRWNDNHHVSIAGIWAGKKEEHWYAEKTSVKTDHTGLNRVLDIVEKLS